jgi:hypothetical protein
MVRHKVIDRVKPGAQLRFIETVFNIGEQISLLGFVKPGGPHIPVIPAPANNGKKPPKVLMPVSQSVQRTVV